MKEVRTVHSYSDNSRVDVRTGGLVRLIIFNLKSLEEFLEISSVSDVNRHSVTHKRYNDGRIAKVFANSTLAYPYWTNHGDKG